MLSLFAAAKINLSLKVLRRRSDGYHDLQSLVAFADIGDRLFVKKSAATELNIVGPFAAGLQTATNENLVLRAVRAFERAAGHALPTDIVLEKNLPVASGIGGGSADAAAALRGLQELYAADMPAKVSLVDMAADLGADVPVCLQTGPAWMRGIGHDVTRPVDIPEADIVLVNPRLGAATADIFAALVLAADSQAEAELPGHFDNAPDWLDFLRAQGNDLQPAAISLVPEIGDCLAALQRSGAAFHAMSGSGATCFALCPPGQGKSLAARYRTLREKDWVRSGRLISAGD